MITVVERPGGQAIRLVHTADVHIGCDSIRPADGDHLEPSCLCPILGVVAAVRETSADALVIAGDLFDHGRVAESVVEETFRLLAGAGVPIVLLPGNHDVHDDGGVFRRFRHHLDAVGVAFVDELDGTTGSILDGRVTFWGRAMAEHAPSFRPVEGAPPRPDADAFHLVLAHGLYLSDNASGDSLYRSSPIRASELAALDADYVALGHVHVSRDLSTADTAIFYAGSPVERRRAQTVRVVDLCESGVTTADHPVTIDAAGCASAACDSPGELSRSF